MAFRITDGTDSVQKISAIPLAAATGTRAAARYDGAATSGTHTSFVAAVYCEEDTTNGNQMTIWELYNGATCTMGVRLQFSAGNWILSSHLAGSSSTINWTLPIDPRGKWLLISMCHINRTSAVSDRLLMAVYDFSTGLTHTTGAGVFTGASATAPTHAAIGNNVMFGTGNRNMRGIVIPAIRTDAIWDGTSPIDSIPTVAISALAAGGITGHISYASFASVIWAANYVAANRTGGYDSRDGQVLTTSNMYGLDVNHGIFPTYGQIALGCAVTGTITAVDPYDYGGISYPPPTDTTVGSDSLPATALTLAASGRRSRNLTKLANWINDGTGSGQLRVGFFANSRAVYPYGWALRLSDGTYPGRTLPSNFNDMGIIGQAGLWNNGRIIGMFVPPPTCNWTGTNQLEGAYGVDCSAGLLRTRDSGGTAVNPSTVLNPMTSTTLGTRMSLAARAANTPPSSGVGVANAYGAGNSVRLSAGCTYRVMVRPEAGLPVTDPLTVRLHLINHPSSSTISAAKKVVAAGQNNAEDSSSAIAYPGLGASSASAPPTAKSITTVSAASLSSQVAHTAYGYVTVDDTDLGFSGGVHPIEVGDLMQLQDSGGATSTYNEAWIVREVTGAGTDNCAIYYEWLPRQAPVIGDKVTYVKHDEVLVSVTATFTANEVAAGKWRGIEITADAAGDGVLIYAVEFINPARDGVHVCTIGRTGCGAWIQAARWPRIADPDGSSLCKRIFGAMDLDVLVLTTADQGTASGNYVASYNTIIDYVRADSPSTDLVLYSTGPEWQGESTFNKVDYGDKYDWAAAMQYAAAAKGVPHTAFQFGRNISAFGRITTGDDTTEGPVHPGTVLDVSFLGAQLDGLRAEATSLNHGFGGRTRSALRYRTRG
jgi:hypothetical protein